MIKMVPLFSIHLLLMALLLQHTEEKKELRRQKPPKHDEVVHHQEFCLSIPEAPHSTGLDFETPQPTKSASKPKPVREKPNTPKLPLHQTDVHGAPLSEEETNPPVGVPEIVPRNVPRGSYSSVPDGCYCKEQNKKLSTETYQVSSLNIRYPSKTCRSTEYIEILKDGRKVCATAFSLLAHYLWSLSQLEQRPTESPEITSTTHQSTAAETSTPTHLQIRTNASDMYYGPGSNGVENHLKIWHGVELNQTKPNRYFDGPQNTMTGRNPPGHLGPPPRISAIIEPCTTCIHPGTWNKSDLKDIQLVDLNFPSSNCPAFILVSLTDGRHICMNSFHPDFLQLLDKLENKEP